MCKKLWWWAYKHINGSYQFKRYFSHVDLDEAYESPFVDEVYGPWPAKNRQEAETLLSKEIGVTHA